MLHCNLQKTVASIHSWAVDSYDPIVNGHYFFVIILPTLGFFFLSDHLWVALFSFLEVNLDWDSINWEVIVVFQFNPIIQSK